MPSLSPACLLQTRQRGTRANWLQMSITSYRTKAWAMRTAGVHT